MKINYIIFSIVLILMCLSIFLLIFRDKEIIKTLNENITVKLYTNKSEKIIDKIKDTKDSDEIASILKKENVDKFIINNNGNITAGKHYDNGKYLVSLLHNNNLLDIIELENESLYVINEKDFYVAVISKNIKSAKAVALDVKNGILDENKKIYIYKNEKKEVTKSFNKYIK